MELFDGNLLLLPELVRSRCDGLFLVANGLRDVRPDRSNPLISLALIGGLPFELPLISVEGDGEMMLLAIFSTLIHEALVEIKVDCALQKILAVLLLEIAEAGLVKLNIALLPVDKDCW